MEGRRDRKMGIRSGSGGVIAFLPPSLLRRHHLPPTVLQVICERAGREGGGSGREVDGWLQTVQIKAV